MPKFADNFSDYELEEGIGGTGHGGTLDRTEFLAVPFDSELPYKPKTEVTSTELITGIKEFPQGVLDGLGLEAASKLLKSDKNGDVFVVANNLGLLVFPESKTVMVPMLDYSAEGARLTQNLINGKPWGVQLLKDYESDSLLVTSLDIKAAPVEDDFGESDKKTKPSEEDAWEEGLMVRSYLNDPKSPSAKGPQSGETLTGVAVLNGSTDPENMRLDTSVTVENSTKFVTNPGNNRKLLNVCPGNYEKTTLAEGFITDKVVDALNTLFTTEAEETGHKREPLVFAPRSSDEHFFKTLESLLYDHTTTSEVDTEVNRVSTWKTRTGRKLHPAILNPDVMVFVDLHKTGQSLFEPDTLIVLKRDANDKWTATRQSME